MRGEMFLLWLPLRRRYRLPDYAVTAFMEPHDEDQDIHVLLPAEPGEIWTWHGR